MRAGHYPPCSPNHPFFVRGHSDHHVAFCKADFHNINDQQAAAPAASAAPESESRFPEASSNRNSPTKQLDPQDNDSQDNDAQDNMWVTSWSNTQSLYITVWTTKLKVHLLIFL